jgi:acyl-CoA thioesterase-2
MSEIVTLAEILTLEPIEVNLFRGLSPANGPPRIFGGQVIAQALVAAYATVPDRLCHSLHCYFIRPGDPAVPILYEVDRARDGTSFTTRRVTAIQHGKQIFNLAASFQVAEEGFEHQAAAPAAPSPDSVALHPGFADQAEEEDAFVLQRRSWPVELRQVEPGPEDPAFTARMWMRSRSVIGDEPRVQQAALAFASDMALLGTSVRDHVPGQPAPEIQFASLDHAVWFHRPIDFNQWHLYDADSPSAGGGRGFNRGQLFSQDGVLVASVAQEGLIRRRR